MKLAILGATSHIAKGLIARFIARKEHHLYLYTRSPGKLKCFLRENGLDVPGTYEIFENYTAFHEVRYHGIINCIGAGTFKHHRGDLTTYFMLTERFDNMVLDHLSACPEALYISISSGAVYGREQQGPVSEHSVNRIKVNHLPPEDYYSVARLNSEAKHRAFARLNIVDIRIFSYFSRYMDLSESYFMADLLTCVKAKKVFRTNHIDIVRDYLHPDDVFGMLNNCLDIREMNDAFDMSSRRPVRKTEVLDYFSREYGLEYVIDEEFQPATATGLKTVYCSDYRNAAKVGHQPKFSSMDSIQQESAHLLRTDVS
jgi:hypothetical protein